MPIQDSDYIVSTDRLDSKSLAVLFETSGRKLSLLFEISVNKERKWKGKWTSSNDTLHWQTGERVTESERSEILSKLNDWGKGEGWCFEFGIKLLDLKVEDVPPDERESIRRLQELARRSVEARRKVYDAASKKSWWRFW